LLGGNRLSDHLVENDLKGLSVAAPTMYNKVFAITLPSAIIKTHGVVIIAAVELHRKLVEAKPIAFTGISPRFFDFADHAAVHIVSPLRRGRMGWNKEQKSTQQYMIARVLLRGTPSEYVCFSAHTAVFLLVWNYV
jgi:hypothetical protein